MTPSLSALRVRALVLDIEGTTTRVDFVYKVLFPYARAHAGAYLARAWQAPACREAVALLREEMRAGQDAAQDAARGAAQDVSPAVLASYVGSLMDEDCKSRGLKMLQGLIWDEGYRSGELRGEVYPDVPAALARWRARGLGVYIYSSGSVLAQRLLFGSTRAGDLTTLLDGYFDTAIGAKISADSYWRIAEAVAAPPAELLFVSDVAAELDAASAAGLRTALCVRPGAASPGSSAHPVIHDFGEILD